MKKLWIIFWLIFCTNSVLAEVIEGKDQTKYDILDESYFSVLFYDTRNSMAEQLGGRDTAEGEFNTALILGNLNLVEIKKQVIENLVKHKISLFRTSKPYDINEMEEITEPLSEAINNYIKNFKGHKKMEDAMIYFYMLNPDIYRNLEYPKAISYNAASIAISRFDIQYWAKRIKECFEIEYKANDSNSRVLVIQECAKGYQKAVEQEVEIVLQQLKPYFADFESLRQIPEDELELVTSKSGQSWSKRPKNKKSDSF